jgi:hypothetical protein
MRAEPRTGRRPERDRDDAAMGRRALWVLAVIAIVIGGWYAWRQVAVEPAPPPEVVQEPVKDVAATPVIEHPVEPAPQAEPLPPLDDSDSFATEQLAGLLGADAVASLFLTDDLVRRITVTVDNLPREKAALRQRPLKPMDSAFIASGEEGAWFLGPDNYARYVPFVRIVEGLDPDTVAAFYTRLYPLFQQAYAELGHLDGDFNDRVVEVIDHLLAAQAPDGPVALVRPNVMYQFADPGLESRSAGQKFLVRLGPDNAARVKAQLQALRERLASRPPPAG